MNADLSLDIPGKRMRPFDIKDFILRRSVLILALGFIIFLTLSPAALILKKPYFQTGGTLILSPEVNMLAPRDVRKVPGLFRDFAMTHTNRLKSEVVIRKALTDYPRNAWPSFLPPEIPVSTAAAILSRKIVANQVGESQLLFVGIVGDEPAGLAEVVNQIMETYIVQLEEEQERDSRRRLGYLSQEKEGILNSIEGLKEKRVDLAVKLKSNSFNELRNPAYEKLIASQVNFLNASALAMEKKSLLEKAEREQSVLGSEDLTVFAREMVETNEAVYMIDNWTYQRLQDLRAGIDGLTEENTDRIHVEERMKAMTEYLTKFKSDMHKTMLGILNEKRDFELGAEKTRAEGAFLAAKNHADTLGIEMEKTFREFTESSVAMVQGMEVAEEISHHKDRLSFFDQRISEVMLDAKAPIFLSLEEPARSPIAPAGDRFLKILMMIFAGSMGSVVFSTLAYELLDGRVKSPGDVKSALGGEPLVPVPAFLSNENNGAFNECIKNDPYGPCGKAIQNSIVRLNIQREQNDAKIFLFCGSSSFSGVSSLVENFADGFAQYVGQVLIVSLQDKGHIPSPGKDDSAEESVIAATLDQFPENESWVAKIDLTNESRLMRKRSNLPAFLSEARNRFGVVLIDAPPLADSALTQFLAAGSDTVVLVARRGCTKYPALRKDVELLFRMGVPGLSAIFNSAVKQPMDHLLEAKTKVVEVLGPQLKSEISKIIYQVVGRLPKISHKQGAREAGTGRRELQGRAVETETNESDDDIILPR